MSRKSKRFKLTKAARVIILVLILAIIGGGGYWAFSSGLIKTDKKTEASNNQNTSAEKNEDANIVKTGSSNTTEINLSLDEWTGWQPIILANDGLTTQPGSIFDELGIKVNIHIINDATQSSNALIKGDLNAAGYTVNRTAFLSQKFSNAGKDVVMPYITNYSNGGDGIIATNKYQSIESLTDAKIGVPQFSEAHSLVVWFVNQSDLSQDDKDKIISNLIFFETPDEVAKAFFAGEIDVAATWQPYLTQAENMTDCHVLFSTASSSKLILDGILFDADWAESNRETVEKFIEGCLLANDLYGVEFDAVREAMPMFSGMSDEDIKASTLDAALATWNNNKTLFSGEVQTVYSNMCDVWTSIGESVNADLVDSIFDFSYMASLENEFSTLSNESENTVKVTEDNKEEIIDAQALLTKSASVNFVINTAKFSDTAEASKVLNEFIDVAKVLDGTIIQIEGNTDPNPDIDPDDTANKMLSKQRAETVKQYFIANGISADRIIVVGNGSSNPIVENDTEEHKAMNRRTDVYFKIIE